MYNMASDRCLVTQWTWDSTEAFTYDRCSPPLGDQECWLIDAGNGYVHILNMNRKKCLPFPGQK
jgi:hypothetical protein